MDPSFRNTIPLGAALFTTLKMKKHREQKELDTSDRDLDLSDSLFPFDTETHFSGY